VFNSLKLRWQTVVYNYSWSNWVPYIDGWIPRFSLLFPFVGYLILVNDEIAKVLQFHHLTGTEQYAWGLSAVIRLRLVYYGLFFLGVSNFIYRLKKPYAFRFGANLIDYTKTGLELFTLGDYVQIHGTIRHEGHLTLDGKYYDSEWEGICAAARNQGEGTDKVVRSGSWEDAKRQYGSLLRSMLRENFFRNDTRGRSWLTACVLLSTLGYLLLAIPSLDLFAKVTADTLGIVP
jgi:hypothetical protein